MNPIKFGEANHVYRGPTPDVGDLWCYIPEPGMVCTVWELTDEERALIAAGGRIELVIHNEPIPPVALGVLPEDESRPVGEHPFKVIPELLDPERRGDA